jgi:hypothetical protein
MIKLFENFLLMIAGICIVIGATAVGIIWAIVHFLF